MNQSIIWKAQLLFVSSTFTDMMAERDLLRDVIFPELEEKLRERRLCLESIDLRRGLKQRIKKSRSKKNLWF